MLLGVHIFPTQFSIQPDELALAAEERGLEFVWFSEHTHIPVRFLNTPGRGATLPEFYWQTYDIFIAMTVAATAAKNIKVGTGVSLVVERNPILLAKEAATLDLLSKGRFIFGIGAGWLEAEMADHGVAYSTRFQLLKERIRAIKEIWTTGESEFHGRYVNFDKMKAFPKPYQTPYPPIIMGGAGDKALECAAELCDGWAPWGMEWTRVKDSIAELKQKAVANGRDPNSLEISLFEESMPDIKILEDMETAGIKRLILTIFGQSRDQALTTLDLLAKINR